MMYIIQKVVRGVVACLNSKIKILIGLFCILSLAACGETYLQQSEIQKLIVEYEKINNVEYVFVRGIPFHSVLSPTQYSVSDNEDSINIKVKLELSHKKLGLPLDIRVAIRDKTKYITFGDNGDIIWKRESVAK